MTRTELRIGDTFFDNVWDKTITIEYLNHDTDTVGLVGYEGTMYLKSTNTGTYLFGIDSFLHSIKTGMISKIESPNVTHFKTFGAFSLN